MRFSKTVVTEPCDGFSVALLMKRQDEFMAQPPVISLPKVSPSTRDIGFALGIVAILCVLFLPIPIMLVDILSLIHI